MCNTVLVVGAHLVAGARLEVGVISPAWLLALRSGVGEPAGISVAAISESLPPETRLVARPGNVVGVVVLATPCW